MTDFLTNIQRKTTNSFFKMLQIFVFVVMCCTITLFAYSIAQTPINPFLNPIDQYEAEFLIRTEDVEKVFIHKESELLFITFQGCSFSSTYGDYDTIVSTIVNYAPSPELLDVNLDVTKAEIFVQYNSTFVVMLTVLFALTSFAGLFAVIGIAVLRYSEKNI